jgi:hypothetical protein
MIVNLASLGVINGALRETGLLARLIHLLQHRCESARSLLVRTCVLAAVCSSLLTNDATVLVLTTPVLESARRFSAPLEPFALALVTSANLGSALTVIGNPQNVSPPPPTAASTAHHQRPSASRTHPRAPAHTITLQHTPAYPIARVASAHRDRLVHTHHHPPSALPHRTGPDREHLGHVLRTLYPPLRPSSHHRLAAQPRRARLHVRGLPQTLSGRAVLGLRLCARRRQSARSGSHPADSHGRAELRMCSRALVLSSCCVLERALMWC